jgi:hypothetical protein
MQNISNDALHDTRNLNLYKTLMTIPSESGDLRVVRPSGALVLWWPGQTCQTLRRRRLSTRQSSSDSPANKYSTYICDDCDHICLRFVGFILQIRVGCQIPHVRIRGGAGEPLHGAIPNHSRHNGIISICITSEDSPS